ncbi:hypothetical protein BDV18DRAFT_147084 [Aspergillus unguis]
MGALHRHEEQGTMSECGFLPDVCPRSVFSNVCFRCFLLLISVGVYVINHQNMKLDRQGRFVALDADVSKWDEQAVMRLWAA